MLQLLLAVLCSAAMAVVLKCFRDTRGNRYGIILGNYLTCVLLSLLQTPERGALLTPHAATLLLGTASGAIYVAGIVTLQSSIRRNGAMLTTAVSRLGLLVSLAVSIAWFGERPDAAQLVGIALVLAAMVLIHTKRGAQTDGTELAFGLLVLTMLTNGACNAMTKVFEQLGSRSEDTAYFFWLFLTAAAISAALGGRERRRTGKKLLLKEAAAGALVGVPNYASSYLLLRALAHLPAFLVFPLYSACTILVVTAVSALVFRERPGGRQVLGLCVILAAVVLLNL